MRSGWGRRCVLRGVMNPGVWLRRRGAAVCLPGLLGLRVGGVRGEWPVFPPARVYGLAPGAGAAPSEGGF